MEALAGPWDVVGASGERMSLSLSEQTLSGDVEGALEFPTTWQSAP